MNARIVVTLALLGVLVAFHPGFTQENSRDDPMSTSIELPTPTLKGDMSLEEALSLRRSRRNLVSGSLTIQQVSQILWAAQGITAKGRYRTAPSAGALYPIELYAVVVDIEGLAQGMYHYSPQEHSLLQRMEGPLAKKVAKAALGQEPLKDAALIIVITAEIERTSWKYGDRADRYVAQETGAVAQNIYLQVESLGLSTVFIGAFYDEKVQKALEITETPMAILPIGHRAK